MDSNKFLDGNKHNTLACIDEQKHKQIKKKMPMEKKKKKDQRMVTGKSKSVKSKAKKITSDPATKSRSKRKRTGANDIYEDVEAKFTVMERAERVLSSLEDETPCFVKCMLPSNVTYSFWMIIPKKFCNLHLPSQDSTIILVDELGKEYKTNYLIDRHGLSAGWRGFSISHRLLKGDILIFRLIEPCKLEVHIVRVHDPDVVNAALCLMNMDTYRKTADPVGKELGKQDSRKRKRVKKHEEAYLVDAPKVTGTAKEGRKVSKSTTLTLAEQSGKRVDRFGSQFLKGSDIPDHRCSETSILHDRHYKGVVCR